tara:strand:- start:676 stop:2358 length:1683 start_codon:yes stop_codon:yes gene_type:complete
MSEQEAKKIFDSAIKYYNDKNYSLAEKNFEQALKLVPKRLSILDNLALIYFINSKYEKSLETINELLKLEVKEKKIIDLKFKLLLILGKTKELQKFIDDYLIKNTESSKYKIIRNLIYPNFFDDQKQIDEFRTEFIKSLDKVKDFKNTRLKIDNELIDPPIFSLSYDQYENIDINKKIVEVFRKIYPELNQSFLHSQKNQKIKIGFISEFFYNHTISKLFKGIILNLNRDKFDIAVFHTEKTKRDSWLDEFLHSEIKSNIKNFILPKKINDKIKLIINQNLDIVFYPDIGMSTELYFLSFIRFAKIQITSWGHPITTGNNSIDYFFSSKLIEKKDSQKFYSEKLLLSNYLPMYFYEPKISKKLSDNEIVNKNLYFCSQSLIKIHPHFDQILKMILEKDKKAKIFFIRDKENILAIKLQKRFKKNIPLNYERIKFLDRMNNDEYIDFCGKSSVLLDTLYFGAGNSFHESMIYGTPTITMPKDTLKSRIVLGAYKQMKIDDPPVVDNIDAYVEKAVELANLDEKKMIDMKKYYSNNAKKYLYENKNFLIEFENILLEIYSPK